MRWIGYFLVSILILILILIFIKIKTEVKWTKEEQWVEFRYLMFKYRLNLDDFLSKNSKDTNDQETTIKKMEKTINSTIPKNVENEKDCSSQLNASNQNKRSDKMIPKQLNNLDEKVLKSNNVVKKKRRWVKAQKAKNIFKSPKIFSINFIRKVNVNYLRVQYRRFKIVFNEGKIILYRIFSRIKIISLRSSLQFNVDDPSLNAHLVAIIWAVEANFYNFLQRRFKKVKNHHFDVKTQFNGNDIFFELSCIVSIRIADIILVGLFSLKEILYIKKIIFIEKEV